MAAEVLADALSARLRACAVWEHVFAMGADAGAYARLGRALAAGQLAQAEDAARELPRLSIEDTLGLVLLMLRDRDARFERAAVKWLGRVLSDRPQLGLVFAGEVAQALADLPATPEVARSRLAVLLRHGGLTSSAVRLETEAGG